MNDNRFIVISDSHGCWYTLVRLLNECVKRYPGAKVLFNGDEIDRGPHSRRVVEFAMDNHIPTVMGNHQSLCLDFYGRNARCASYYDRGVWLENGGDVARDNWPKIPVENGRGRCVSRVPDYVLDWMEQLPAYIKYDGPNDPRDENGRALLLGHTGYSLSVDGEGSEQDNWFRALWTRREPQDTGPFSGDPVMGNWYRVVGHTPVKEAVVQTDCAFIDTGAAYASRGYGHLSAFIWPTKEVISVATDETVVEAAFKVVEGDLVPL